MRPPDLKLRAYLLGLLLAIVCLMLAGCSSATLCKKMFPESCDPVGQPCEPVVVTEYKPHDPLPTETPPEETYREVPSEETGAFLEALGVDYLKWRAFGLKMLHVIEAFNESQSSETPSQ